ncbi:MAG: hypothetical protein M3Z66_05375 [Chloroflexota bacterium]|nr:hypothetical protein [Chloroflexota bacterium]
MESAQDEGLTSQIGPLEVDWPRAIGYYGGITAAVAFGVFELPVGIFIGAVPFFKMLTRPRASLPERVVGQVLEGAAKPVGGDAEATVRISQGSGSSGRRRGWILRLVADETKGIWSDARRVSAGEPVPSTDKRLPG